MILGLVIIAIGFFLGFFKPLSPAQLAFYCVGWALVLYFGLKALLAPHGVTI